jgi:S1-C subfamily serine protease
MKKPTTQIPKALRPEPKVIHWFHRHVHAALWLTLAASIGLFGAVVIIKNTSDMRQFAQRSSDEKKAALKQRDIERRLAAMEEANAKIKLAFETGLAQLSEDQRTADARESGSPVKSPFALETVMGSIVEVVCIDNVDQDVYYTGSGTVVDKSGVIVTNHHLLLSDDGSLIRYCGIGFTTDLKDPPIIKYIAASTAVHKDSDLAILVITEAIDNGPLPKTFPFISLRGATEATQALNLGDPVYIGGYPNIGADTFTFTQGVVSGRVGPTYIKTSAIIDTGASGGAAFDSSGRYIGTPTAAAKGEIGGSLGYLIGADVVDQFLLDYYSKKKTVSTPVE